MKDQMMELQWNENETISVNKNFWDMISCLDERFKVLDYLMNHRAGPYALGTIKDISEGTGLSAGRVQKFLKVLEEKDILQREGNGVFVLPPAMIPNSEKAQANA